MSVTLLGAGFIDGDIMALGLLLRQKSLAVTQLEEKWEAEAVRTGAEWREILRLSDRIREMKEEFDRKRSGG